MKMRSWVLIAATVTTLFLSGCTGRKEPAYSPLVLNQQTEIPLGVHSGGSGAARVDIKRLAEALGGTVEEMEGGWVAIDVNGTTTNVGERPQSAKESTGEWLETPVYRENSTIYLEINTVHDLLGRSHYAVAWQMRQGKFYLDLKRS